MTAVFVHLSDIHFGQEKDGGQLFINDDAKRSLLADARREIEALGVAASGVIVTGDIAYAGKPEQYAKAGEWLDRLACAVGCNRVDIQMVPGNHDIDRDAITSMTRWYLETIREQGDTTLDMLLDDERGRESLYERFKGYRDFAEAYGCDLDVGGQYSADGAIDLAPGRRIRFVRLNSALICARRDDEGKLILGARQRVFEGVEGEEMVVLVHHPLRWLQDSAEARRYFRSRARVVISGHEHFPSLEVDRVDDGCDLMMLAAGATAPEDADEKYTYKYNILTFEWDEHADALAVSINPRTWNFESKRFERDDAFLEDRPHRTVLASPYFRGAPTRSIVEAAAPTTGRQEVQAVANPVTGSSEADLAISEDARLVRLRFFRDLTERQRRGVLVEMGAFPADLADRLDHTIERRFFGKLVEQGRVNDLVAAMERAAANEAKGNGR